MPEKPHNFTMKLQVVMLPVNDVDKSIAFYRDTVGFNLDHDVNHGDVRVVQLTPTGSNCSIVMGENMEALQQMQAGSIRGLHLVVNDIVGVRNHLTNHNVEVSEIVDYGGGIKMAGFSDLTAIHGHYKKSHQKTKSHAQRCTISIKWRRYTPNISNRIKEHLWQSHSVIDLKTTFPLIHLRKPDTA